ncbi:hypothetical protein RRG08_022192 [Elysia crispata]|uniref:Uncharacterized protein n=1 Tax=Elysia crispata TaxID=231223 RepID=A0AAE1D736_9GAST|nr:hypothetical protein RRG08_022192 [Elysia crispata]
MVLGGNWCTPPFPLCPTFQGTLGRLITGKVETSDLRHASQSAPFKDEQRMVPYCSVARWIRKNLKAPCTVFPTIECSVYIPDQGNQ